MLWLNAITDIQKIRRDLYVNCCRKWIAFVACRNADGLPRQPRDGDRISDHFVSKEKSDVSKGVSSVAGFERAQR